jgi:predicted enzyme related to lactoylglutathione lyase
MNPVTVGWFEIPVRDMDRAITFYENVFGCKLSKQVMGDFQMAWFPNSEGNGAPGSLVFHEKFYAPSEMAGPLIYLNSEDCSKELSLIPDFGGKILIEKRQISPEIGFMAVFLDSEGNRIALFSSR